MLYLISFLCFSFLLALFFYKKRIQQLLMLWKLTKNLNITSPNDISTKNEESGKFIVHETDKSATVTYIKDGKLCKISFPINLRNSIYMSDLKVDVLLGDGKKPLDITQEPGIPYFVTPVDYNGISIRVVNNSTGSTRYYFDAPMYCEDLYDIE